MAVAGCETLILSFFDWLRHLARRRRWAPKLAVGRRGEDLAHRYLQTKGYVVVARNYRLSSGEAEADIIAWEKDSLVFIEVKTRESAEYGPPERAVGEEKRKHMLRIARQYTRKSQTPWEQVRFDIVSVVMTDPPSIELFRDALPVRSKPKGRRASA